MLSDPQDVPAVLRFLTEAAPREGVNTLILEIGYNFAFASHPELAAQPSISRDDARRIVAAASRSGVEIIPMLNCLGHQSWAKTTFSLLTAYPEFDETPGLYPGNEGIYCRSYCPLHPGLHPILFSLLDELAEAFQARSFHVGMDEVFLIGEDGCPRCQGKDRGALFADEVIRLHDHLASKGISTWIWGDRLIDGKLTGIGKWEAAVNGTNTAIDRIPRDVVICDWHYEFSPPMAGYFVTQGFPTVMSPWRKSDVALGHLQQIRAIQTRANPELAARARGMVHTTWTQAGAFMRAYFGEAGEVSDSARESAACFKALFKAIRELD